MKEKVKAATFHNHFVQMVSKREFDPVSLAVSVHLLLSKVIHHWTSLLQIQHSWLIRSYSVQEQSKQAAASSAQCLVHARLLKLRSNFRCYSYFQCHQPLPALLWVFAWISYSQSAWWHLWACRNQPSHRAQIPRCPWLAVERKHRYFVSYLHKSSGVLQPHNLPLYGRYYYSAKGHYHPKQPLNTLKTQQWQGNQGRALFI